MTHAVRITRSEDDDLSIEIADDSAYVADDDANFQFEVETYLFLDIQSERAKQSFVPALEGARPILIDSFNIASGFEAPSIGFSLAWVYDESLLPWTLVISQPEMELLTTVSDLQANGYRPISISSRWRSGEPEYSAIFVSDGVPDTHWDLTIGSPIADVPALVLEQYEDGFYSRVGSVTEDTRGDSLYDTIWAKLPETLAIKPVYSMTNASFEAEDTKWRTQGYHLVTASPYTEDGDPRSTGTWVRHEPHARWTGTSNVDSKYDPFHDQAFSGMDMSHDPNETGALIRPSGPRYWRLARQWDRHG